MERTPNLVYDCIFWILKLKISSSHPVKLRWNCYIDEDLRFDGPWNSSTQCSLPECDLKLQFELDICRNNRMLENVRRSNEFSFTSYGHNTRAAISCAQSPCNILMRKQFNQLKISLCDCSFYWKDKVWNRVQFHFIPFHSIPFECNDRHMICSYL